MRDDPLVEVDVVVKRVTQMAILVNHGIKEEVWIPKSQIASFEGGEHIGHETTVIFIPEWLAFEKGIS